jgi:hypothetical protein
VRLLFLVLLSSTSLLTPAWAQDAEHSQEPAPPVSDTEQADRACAMLAAYAKMGISDDSMKSLLIPCSANPDPRVTCNTLLVFKMSNRANPGLVCDKCERLGLTCN